MPQPVFKTDEPVILDGYQAVMKPSKFGYSLTALVGEDLVSQLEPDREESLKWAEGKLKNPKRSVLKPEPWEEVAEGKFKVKFSWQEDNRPPVVDTEGTVITDENLPIYGGSRCKLAFKQKPYILKDGITYGTSLKLIGVQLVALNTDAGVDGGDLSSADIADLFGTTTGFKASAPNVTATLTQVSDDDF
jgi:hypothetical protein